MYGVGGAEGRAARPCAHHAAMLRRRWPRLQHWVGVWQRLQLLSVPDGGGTDAAKPKLFRTYACVDRVHVSGRDRGLRLLVEKLDFE